MSDDVREDRSTGNDGSGIGPLRHFRADRRAVLRSLATGVGAAAFALPATAAHMHHAAAAATIPADAAATDGAASLLFLDPHGFETLSVLSEQIVPGSRAAKVPEFLDRLLAVESTDTQRRFAQAIGAFERAAREAQGKPWKALSSEHATALLTKMSRQPDEDPARRAFEGLKGAIAETYFSSEAGMKELGWTGNVAFAPPSVCG